jgi:hypothetical protein
MIIKWRRAALRGGLLLLLGLAIVLLFTHRPPESSLALVTVEDCRRSFDDATCRSIILRAQAIHADAAPNFAQRSTCELIYGIGKCAALKEGLIDLNRFAPTMVAILLTRTRDGIVPLYFGPPSDDAADPARTGREVYFHGAPVGKLVQLGGMAAAFVADSDGAALSADAVRKLHGP